MSTKRKLPQKLAQPKVNQSAKVLREGKLNDSGTVVTGGGNLFKARTNGIKEVVEISSDSSEGEEDEEDSADDSAGEQGEAKTGDEIDVTMEDAPIEEELEDNGKPSFGELARANASEPIDVAGAFEEPDAVVYKGAEIQPPSGTSLGTVLSQALRTNDVSLLESCLHTTDVQVVRATIQRLESPLAGTLLQKLADRLHRRPGRSGILMVWVQWTLVTHGGYLATQKDLVKKLSDLNKVIDERARGLQALLSLKGKLDMLEAQIELRKNIQQQRTRMDEDEVDEAVIYVEGQESDDQEGVVKPQRINGIEDISDDESEISEDMPTTNGVIADSEGDEESSDDNMLDDEAEETDADSGDEDEVDYEDYDSEAEESEDGDAGPPSKLQRLRR